MFHWIMTLLAARRLRNADAIFMTESGGDPDPEKRTACIRISFRGPKALENCHAAATDLLTILGH